MKSIMVTYPDFRLLPKGLKQLLLASENFFFEEAKLPSRRREEKPSFMPNQGKEYIAKGSLSHPAWRN
jgi:hypothetical protein